MAPPGWYEVDGLLLFKGRILHSAESSLWPQIPEQSHTMGHEGSEKTLHAFEQHSSSPKIAGVFTNL
jgi:hypothetical protein